jgi:predicted Zn-ribbon and HTH transcriptional regulator
LVPNGINTVIGIPVVDEETAIEKTRRLLELVRERVDYAIGRLKTFEEVKALSWRCRKCGYTKKFTRPVPLEVAVPCPKCRSGEFEPG